MRSIHYWSVLAFRACPKLITLATLFLSFGCVPNTEDTVVIYSAADREYAQPILAGFQRRNEGTKIAPVFDVESTKSVGLVARIESEAKRPRCDVFWNNEVIHTIRLAKQGLLQPVNWDIPADWPSEMLGTDGVWLGIAARARILLVNRDLIGDERPTSVMDLADPKWKGKCAFAEPLAGTTATHFAILDTTLGKDKARDFFEAAKKNAIVVSGNKQVAQMVASGKCAFGLTDTDDALIEIEQGLPVEIVFPDQQPDQSGAIRIPNTLCVPKDAPHPVAAAKLANYLASEDTEGRLAMGPSGQFPVRPNHPQKSRATRDDVLWMDVNFEAAADRWPQLAEELRGLFRGQE